MYQMQRKYHFYAAHRNKSAGEKCGRIHGHTYDVVCYFNFNHLHSGLTILFSDVDKVVEPIVKSFDHYFLVWEKDPLARILNDMGEQFIELPFETSAENMAEHLYNLIKKTKLPIVKLDLAETKSSIISYEE